jgi:hypothetical protein
MRKVHLQFVVALALVTSASVASASALVCTETVNLQPSVVVTQFPATVTFDLTVTEASCAWCATQPETHWCHGSCGSSVVMSETDAPLEGFLGAPIPWATTNPPWIAPFPFWMFNGASLTTTVEGTLSSYADCATRARNIPPPYGPVLPDANGVVTFTDAYHVSWNLDGVQPPYVDCSATLQCVPPQGQTRTLGFFKTHPAATAACVSEGAIDLGFITVPAGNTSFALGILYASPAKYADGTKRLALDQSRVLLARQLLVGICNGRVFGSEPADASLVVSAQSALAGTSCGNMGWLQGQLDAFNNSGDTGENPFGNAAPGAYPDPTVKSSGACN